MERKKTNEIYIVSSDIAAQTGTAKAIRGASFLWQDVRHLQASTFFPNCTIVYTTFSEFTINEQFDVVDGEWQSFLKRQHLGIPASHE